MATRFAPVVGDTGATTERDMELPWYVAPAVILGKLYPEISIQKICKEDTAGLPPYLPKGDFLSLI